MRAAASPAAVGQSWLGKGTLQRHLLSSSGLNIVAEDVVLRGMMDRAGWAATTGSEFVVIARVEPPLQLQLELLARLVPAHVDMGANCSAAWS